MRETRREEVPSPDNIENDGATIYTTMPTFYYLDIVTRRPCVVLLRIVGERLSSELPYVYTVIVVLISL